MKSILLAAVMIATANSPAVSHEPAQMQVNAQGTVYRCLNENVNPYGTCFVVGTERWGIDELFDREIGTTINVRFTLYPVYSDDGDTYQVHHVEAIYYDGDM